MYEYNPEESSGSGYEHVLILEVLHAECRRPTGSDWSLVAEATGIYLYHKTTEGSAQRSNSMNGPQPPLQYPRCRNTLRLVSIDRWETQSHGALINIRGECDVEESTLPLPEYRNLPSPETEPPLNGRAPTKDAAETRTLEMLQCRELDGKIPRLRERIDLNICLADPFSSASSI